MIKLENRSPCCLRHQMLMRRHVLPRQVVILNDEQRYLEYWLKHEAENNN